MKKIILVVLIPMLLFASVSAQTVPLGMKYQAVARTLKGDIIPNENISLKINLTGSDSKNIYYSETHQVITSELGLFTLVIGDGNRMKGSFSETPWSSEEIWMEVSILSKDNTNYSVISNSKLLAVPYAFHAGTAGKIEGTINANPANQNAQGGIPSQVWSLAGNRNTNSDIDRLGTTDNQDLIIVTNNIERFKIFANGNVSIQNNLSIEKDLDVKNNLNVYKNVNLNTTEGNTINNGSFTVANNKATNLTGTLSVTGVTNLNNDFNVNNQSASTLSGKLSVDGISKFRDSLNVENQKPTTLSGKLKVEKNSDFFGRVNINVPFNTVTTQNQYDNYPLKVEGTTQGIAIRLLSTTPGNEPNENNNFITFLNEFNEPKGRIEGQRGFVGTGWDIVSQIISLPDDTLNTIPGITPPDTSNSALPTPIADLLTSSYSLGLISQTIDFLAGVIRLVANATGAFAGLAVLGDIDDVVWNAVDVIVANYQLMAYIITNEVNAGVAFESGGADYAEWLPKAEANEKMSFGDVVGVKGGRISKKFESAEKFMIVSRAPVIIGGMPDQDMEANYEKIAFMGQVPVKVIGKAFRGDYILPTGKNDGMAIAVHPSKMLANDYKRIIGIAWSDADTTKLLNYINTAVGINSNDMAGMIEQMQSTLNNIQIALAQLSPGFKPNFYKVGNEGQVTSSGITTSKSLNEIVMDNINSTKIKSVKEATNQAIKFSAASGADLKRFPLLNYFFENPTPESAQKVYDYYSKALLKAQNLLTQLQSAKRG